MATCELCGLTDGRSKSDLYRVGWDWFTGWLPRTIHVCPTCIKARRREHSALVEQSQSDEAKAEFYIRHPKMKRPVKGGPA